MGTALQGVSEMFNYALGWAGDVMSFITANPVLMLFLFVPFVGLGIGILRRIIRL